MPQPSRATVKQRIAHGISAFEREDYQSALDTFQDVLRQHPGFPDVRNKAGLCLAMLGRAEEALAEFDAALALNSGYAEAHLNRGIVLGELGRHEAALEAFASAGKHGTRDGPEYPYDVGNQIAITHARLGDLYLVADHPAEAAEQYRAALSVRPGFLDIRSKLAEALMETGALAEARAELITILDGNPGFTGARVRLGVVLHRLGRTGEAIREWRRCQSDDPHDMRPPAYLVSVGAAGDAIDPPD